MIEGFDPVACDPTDRERYLSERHAEAHRVPGNEGLMIFGGNEVMLLWYSLIDAFVAGNWIAVTLTGQAMCERGLAGLYAMQDLPETLDFGRSRWDRVGMGTLLGWAREDGNVPAETLDKLQVVCDVRKRLTHWKRPMEPGTIMHRVAERLNEVDDADAEDFDALVERVLADDAMTTIDAVLAFCFGGQAAMVPLRK